MENSTLFNALLDYELYIGAYNINTLQQDLAAISRCKEYLSSFDATPEWVCENGIVICRAVYHYHKTLDRRIKEARAAEDERYLSELREERSKVIRYKSLLQEFVQFVI